MVVGITKEEYGNLSGSVRAICSKSEAHRILICAALCDSPTTVMINTSSKDIEATIGCLEALGASFDFSGDRCTVTPIDGSRKKCVLDCLESGSTIRFLMPVASALGIDATFTGRGRLPERPQELLLDVLREHSVTTSENGEFPIRLSGKMTGGDFTYPGNVSSQYTTGLLLAFPLLDKSSTVRLTGEIQSRPYLDITLDVLEKFGVKTDKTDSTFTVNGDSRYISPKEISVGGDWSNGALFLCLGALSEKGITVTGLDLNSKQGDRKIVDIVRKIGADVTAGTNSVTVKRDGLRGITIDASQTPDLMPVVSALLMFCDGESRLLNCERLKIKECDRLEKIVEMINLAGGKAEENGRDITIYPTENLKENIDFDSYNDHRMVMAESIILTRLSGTISNFEAVEKSYPNMLEALNTLRS